MKRMALILPTKPEDGGQHQYALLIVNSLLKWMNIRYQLTVLCGNRFWRKWCKENNLEFLGYQLPNFSLEEKNFHLKHSLLARIYYTYMTSLGRKIREEKIDILFSLQQGLFIPDYGIKLISPVHDLMHRYEPKFPEVVADYETREIYMKCLAKYSACVLVDSNLGKRQFKESYMKSNQKKPYIFSLPFVAREYMVHDGGERVGVPEKFIFYPAQFWKHKNHINLIKAIEILSETIEDIHLVLVGSEKNYGGAIRGYISKHSLDNHITILGFINDESLVYLYKHATAMVMPSYFGPTNIPPLEAMALGCPVAVSNKYAMPEQVGDAGLTFDPDSPQQIANCISRLWTDDNLRQILIKRGYARSKCWTRKEFAKRLLKIIEFNLR